LSRPEKPIDWKRVDDLLEAGCLGTEIAACFDVHPITFYDRVTKQYGTSFTNYAAEKKACGDTLLREAQFKKATKKLDNGMLVWLGKQRLHQRENVIDNEATEETNKLYQHVIDQLQALQKAPSQLEKSPTPEESAPEHTPETSSECAV
jgi:hypothetical protein